MSIEPQCHFCGASDKFRCKTQEQANDCTQNTGRRLKADEVFDFGFTFADNEETKAAELELVVEASSKELDDLRSRNKNLDNRVKKLYNAILPFLDNLCANPEKPTIHWPNRVEKIQEFKTKLAQIAQGK